MSVLLLAVGLAAVHAATVGAKSERRLRCEMQLRSYIPGQAITTYRQFGSGSFSQGGMVGLGASDNNRSFGLSVSGGGNANKLTGTIKVTPNKDDSKTTAIEKTVDLSDLQPRTILIAKNENGRIYELLLQPRIIETSLPSAFDPIALRLDYWNFENSPVIIDDQTYAGRVGMSGGEVIGLNISGIADVEFSMFPMTDAEPIGIVQDGTLTIDKEGEHTLSIVGVRHGTTPVLLPGPYLVWVRWKEPSMSTEEAKTAVAAQLKHIRKKIEAGELTLSREQLERMTNMSKIDRPTLSRTTSRRFKAGERLAE